jgi:hypothetical protein
MKTTKRVTMTLRVLPTSKAAFSAISAKYEVAPGTVVDFLLERWSLEHDTALAQDAGITQRKPNPFVVTVNSNANTIPFVAPEFQRRMPPDGTIVPTPFASEPAPSAEAETPPSKRTRTP